MNPHTILEALADAFREQAVFSSTRVHLYEDGSDGKLREMNSVTFLSGISAALQSAAAKLKPAEPEANIEKELEKPI